MQGRADNLRYHSSPLATRQRLGPPKLAAGQWRHPPMTSMLRPLMSPARRAEWTMTDKDSIIAASPQPKPSSTMKQFLAGAQHERIRNITVLSGNNPDAIGTRTDSFSDLPLVIWIVMPIVFEQRRNTGCQVV
jgi:hypothetical protein